MATNSFESQLANHLLNARTVEQVSTIKHLAEKQYGIKWRALGDRPNNIGTVGMGSDPGLAVVERITNMFDALLDLSYQLDPKPGIKSPYEAASLYFGIPQHGLSDMDEADRRTLARRMLVSLEDSGKANHPTLFIQDMGVGQSSSRLPHTLLSLNESNKVDKPWTMGTYGQGGSVTFGFCSSTIVLSRRHPQLLNGEDDRVGWTVVEKRFDPTKKALPNYEYLVGHDNEVLSLDPALFPGFEHGTIIIHVEYDLQLKGPYTTNPWQFFNAALFDPVLPFLLAGNRKRDKPRGDRVIYGSGPRLRNIQRARGDIEIAHSDTITLDLGAKYGQAIANYWVLVRSTASKSTSDPTGSYIQPSTAVAVTLHGQRQDAEGRYWIKNNVQLPFLFKNMIIQINADDLTPEAKAELFASTRERGRKSEIRTKMYNELAYNLRNDDQLKALNHQLKERLLQRSTAAANEKVRRRLAKFIKNKLQEFSKSGSGSKEGTSGTPGQGTVGPKEKPGSRGKPRDTSDHHLPNDPTYIRFSRHRLRIHQAERGHIFVEINAKNRYLPINDSFLEIKFSGPMPNALRVASKSALMGGKCRWVIAVDADAPTGEYLLTAELTTVNGLISDTANIEVLNKRKASKKNEKGGDPETGPEVRWVYRDDWSEHGMNAKSVGKVDTDDESVIIWVNRHYTELDKAFKGRNLTPEQIQTRADRYQYPVACGLWLQDFSLRNLADGKPRPTDDYVERELQRLADAVIVAIDPDVDLAAEEES
ncbi:hypothetical protein [Rhodocaloribacter sp.]